MTLRKVTTRTRRPRARFTRVPKASSCGEACHREHDFSPAAGNLENFGAKGRIQRTEMRRWPNCLRDAYCLTASGRPLAGPLRTQTACGLLNTPATITHRNESCRFAMERSDFVSSALGKNPLKGCNFRLHPPCASNSLPSRMHGGGDTCMRAGLSIAGRLPPRFHSGWHRIETQQSCETRAVAHPGRDALSTRSG